MADGESRTLLKTIRDRGRAGLSSGLIRRGSRASAEDRTRPQLQVTDHAGLPRTHLHILACRALTWAMAGLKSGRSRAISVQLTRVMRGHSRLLTVSEVGCSAALSAAICPIPKLIVRVRFSSPAPELESAP